MALRATHVYENFLRRKFSKDCTPTLTLPLKGEGTVLFPIFITMTVGGRAVGERARIPGSRSSGAVLGRVGDDLVVVVGDVMLGDFVGRSSAIAPSWDMM